MVTLASFTTTTVWQEITGVSEVNGDFTLQNAGNQPFLLYEGLTPVDDDALIIGSKGSLRENIAYITVLNNKVWAKGSSPTRIVISKEA